MHHLQHSGPLPASAAVSFLELGLCGDRTAAAISVLRLSRASVYHGSHLPPTQATAQMLSAASSNLDHDPHTAAKCRSSVLPCRRVTTAGQALRRLARTRTSAAWAKLL